MAVWRAAGRAAMWWALATACGRIGFEPLDEFGDDVQPVTVAALYPAHGANWNDYVKNDGPDRYAATDTACDGSEQGYASCIHGGERRKVVTSFTSCAGLSARDALDTFEWRCRADTGVAIFYSSGFLPSRGLQQLVSATAWKPNRIEIRHDGVAVAVSTASAWWSNPVAALPANTRAQDPAIRLDAVDDDGGGPDVALAAGTIIVGSQSAATSGYVLGAAQLALVTLPGVTLTYSGNAATNCNDEGTPQRCVVSFRNRSYVWIEGAFDGASGGANPADIGLLADGDHEHARTHNASFVRNTKFGVLSSINSSVFDDLRVSENGDSGVELHKFVTSDVLFSRLVATSNGGAGFASLSSSRVTVWHGRFANGAAGLDFNNPENTAFDIVAYNNGSYGYNASGGAAPNPNLTIVGLLTFASGNSAINLTSQTPTVLGATSINAQESVSAQSAGATVVRMLTANTGVFELLGSNGARVANLALGGGSLDPGDNSEYTGNLLVASPTQCTSGGMTNPGLATNTCANLGSSTASLRTGINLGASFVGKVTDDASNASQNAGSSPVGSITDWVAFDSPFRGWGLDGSTFPNTDQRGRCITGNCRIWDWRLRASDTMVRDRSGNGVNANEPFVPGGPCPSAVHGDVSIDDHQTRDYVPGINAVETAGDALGNDNGTCEPAEQCFNRFLINAFEIVDDDIGDDDGLCESDEACIYAPNFGAYQGEGDYLAAGTCMFVDGQVQRVKLYAYPINGQ